VTRFEPREGHGRLVQTKGSTGAHGGVAHRGRGGKRKGVGVGSAHEKEKWGVWPGEQDKAM
jgi:hypothetical protein